MMHRNHDGIVREVKSSYTRSYPEMGYIVEKRRFGFYGRHSKSDKDGSVILRGLRLNLISDFISDLRDYYENNPVRIHIDDKRLNEEVGDILMRNSCTGNGENIFLAYTGGIPEDRAMPNISIERVDEETLTDYVCVKLKGYANTEDEPLKEKVNRELNIRASELKGQGCFLLARVGNEPAGIIGFYAMRFPLIYNLAVQVPFRRQGIAHQLIHRVIVDSFSRGCSTVIINVDSIDPIIEFYREFGFTDEVYRRYECMFEP